MELTKEQEDKMLEAGQEAYYDKKNPYALCLSCKIEHKKEEMVEADVKNSDEWLCLECADELRDWWKFCGDYCGCGNELDDDDYANVCKECK